MRSSAGSDEFPNRRHRAIGAPRLTEALNQLERFCEVARSQLVELAESARQWEVLERGLPEAFFDRDTGILHRTGDGDDDSTQLEEDAPTGWRQFDDNDAFVDRLNDVCPSPLLLTIGDDATLHPTSQGETMPTRMVENWLWFGTLRTGSTGSTTWFDLLHRRVITFPSKRLPRRNPHLVCLRPRPAAISDFYCNKFGGNRSGIPLLSTRPAVLHGQLARGRAGAAQFARVF